MQTISFKDAMFRARFTEHGRALLDVVERQPGIALETLIREHDPAPAKLIGAVYAHFAELVKENLTSPVAALEPKDAIGRFPAGGHAVKQLCEAGALVITKRLRVYRPQDLPPRDLSERSDGASSDDSRESEGTPPKESTEGGAPQRDGRRRLHSGGAPSHSRVSARHRVQHIQALPR